MASSILKLGRFVNNFRTGFKFLQVNSSCGIDRMFHLQGGVYGTIKVTMPSLSPTMSEGTIVKWYKKEGDPVNPGDVLCDIQTDKAVVSMDTEEEGILAKILMPENSKDIKIGKLIALMVEEGDDWQNVEVPADEEAPVGATETATAPAPAQPGTTSVEGAADTAHAGFGPSVRKLLEEYNLRLEDIPATGPHGRLLKGDILQFVKSKNLQKVDVSQQVPPPTGAPATPPPAFVPDAGPPPPAYTPSPPLEGEEFTDIPHTNMRRTIAKRLTESKTTIPHSYATIDCNVGPVSKLRKQLQGEGVKVSVNDFIIKSAAIALQRVPRVNTVWQGDTPQLSSAVDVSVAVATSQGLITPIVKNAAYLGVDEISDTVRDLATRARENKLQLHEFQGGSFTISNLGMFGISEFSAVINPPQTAIMAIGSSRPVLGEDGKPQVAMAATLSYDARVIDESEASQFLEVFREIMETPSLTVTGSNLSTVLSASGS